MVFMLNLTHIVNDSNMSAVAQVMKQIQRSGANLIAAIGIDQNSVLSSPHRNRLVVEMPTKRVAWDA